MMRSAIFVLIFPLAIGCGPSVAEKPDANVGLDASSLDALSDDGATPIDAWAVDAEPADFSLVYAHSGQNLYRVDTTEFAAIDVGPFTNLGGPSMTDIAIDKDDRMLGISLSKIFAIDENTGATTLLTDELNTPNLTSLSFVPTDLNDPDSDEILVAAGDNGAVFQIDPETGATEQIGNYGSAGGTLIRSSGDIVAVRGVGIYATVTIGDELTQPDYLATIDPVTWEATPLPMQTNYDKIFGIGFWRGHIYGFVDLGGGQGGAIVELDPVTGESTLVNQGDIRWFGAGVTTDAPIID